MCSWHPYPQERKNYFTHLFRTGKIFAVPESHFCYSALLLPHIMALKTNKPKLLISRNNGISDKTKLSITFFFVGITSNRCTRLHKQAWFVTSVCPVEKYLNAGFFHHFFKKKTTRHIPPWNMFLTYPFTHLEIYFFSTLFIQILKRMFWLFICMIYSHPKLREIYVLSVWAVSMDDAQSFWPALAQASRITWFCKVYTED